MFACGEGEKNTGQKITLCMVSQIQVKQTIYLKDI